MKKQPAKTYLFWILLSELVGLFSAALSRVGIADFATFTDQPELSPPAILFPIVWTILYALMGIGAARVSLEKSSPERTRGLELFIIQLAVNFLWSPIFFNARAFGFALLWLVLLWVLVLLMILEFRKTDKLAAILQIPYLLWLTFALYLNFAVWRLN